MSIRQFAAQNSRFLVVFVCYLALVPIFAGAYYGAYMTRHSRFAFHADLVRAKTLEQKLDSTERIRRLEEKVTALNELHQDLAGKHGEVTLQNVVGDPLPHHDIQTPEFEYEFFVSPTVTDERSQVHHVPDTLEIFRAESQHTGTERSGIAFMVLREGVDIPRHLGPGDKWIFNTADFDGVLPSLTQKYRTLLEGENRVLAGIGDNSGNQWSYWDFLYFSTITQTTVGYGIFFQTAHL